MSSLNESVGWRMQNARSSHISGPYVQRTRAGKKDVSIERMEEALALQPDVFAFACPFCMTWTTEGGEEF